VRAPSHLFLSDPEVYPPGEDSRFLLGSLPDLTGTVADVGTGSGFLACAMASQAGPVMATDVNPAALRLARRNAAENRMQVEIVRADLLRGVRQRFRHIVFNPPYLIPEARGAWIERSWNQDGVLPRFLEEAGDWLLPDGEVHLLVAGDDATSRTVIEDRFTTLRTATRRFFFEEIHALSLRPRD